MVPITVTSTSSSSTDFEPEGVAHLDAKPARPSRLVSELQASRTASVLASMLARGRETTWDTGDEDEAKT